GHALKTAAELLAKDAETQYNYANYLYDQQQFAAALTYYQKAVKLAPHFVQALFNLADVQKALKQWSAAEANYKKAFKLAPQHAHMCFHLGVVLQEQGHYKEAIKQYEKALTDDANNASIHLNLGAAYKALGEAVQAEQCYRQAIALNPQHAGAYNNLGIVLAELQRTEQAEAAYLQAIAIDPNYLPAHKNLGMLYKDLGQGEAAEACYLNALRLEPPSATTLNNMAVVMMHQGRYAEAELTCRQALELDATLGDTWNNLGLILQAKMANIEAAEAFDQALKLQPKDVKTLSNYSVTLKILGKLSLAEACLKQAIQLDPQYVDAYINLGNVYLDQGKITQAVASTKQVLTIVPDHIAAYDNLLFSMTYADQFTAAERLSVALAYGRMTTQKALSPFVHWPADVHAKRLRVGIVSGDLRQHPVAYFLKNMLQHIDTTQIELLAYSTDGREDATSAVLKPYFAEWKSLAGLTDQAAAALIYQDQLHILLDLSGHTGGNKLPLFAWRPAPVQASWLGYWATTGITSMDYVIADVVSVPEQHQADFTEQIRYLPDTRMCFTAPEAAIEVAELPALKNGYVTFGCFQTMSKVSDEVLRLWAQVLQAVPTARLRWQSKAFGDNEIVSLMHSRLAHCGLDPQRVTLVGKVSRDAYLAAHAEVDLILDSFPFTGGTTTCEALWMGVPTLTLAGETMIARQGASLLTAAGLPTWVASSKQDYLAKAQLFSGDLAQLAHTRQGLRAQVLASPLFDGARFAQQMQTLFWQMWQEKAPLLAKQADLTNNTVATHLADQAHKTASTEQLMINIISATRMSEADFWQTSALGLSLAQHMQQDSRVSAHISFNNSLGLSTVFNQAIADADDDAVLVFMHDDVWLDEVHFSEAILDGLAKFDVIGIAGNKRSLPQQPAWLFIDTAFTWDHRDNLSGRIAHGAQAFGAVSHYGAVPAQCVLLDGVFLAAKKATLTSKQVQFDTQFEFHFYDLDFCRTATQAGLSLGTWPIKLTHQSEGAFGSQRWITQYQQYLAKWEPSHMANAIIERNDALAAAVQEVLQHASTQLALGALDNATVLYEEVLKIQPDNAQALTALAQLKTQVSGVQGGAVQGEVVMEQALPLAKQSQVHTCIYQIFYSAQTQVSNDPGFLPLDNLANTRPDWREYWPMRNYLLNATLEEATYYGFLSPKFKEKTGLTAEQVEAFIQQDGGVSDVIAFSPFFDQSAFFLNIFIQGMAAHHDNMQTFVEAMATLNPDVDLYSLVMDANTTIFCNYFVAKPKFWREWLRCCESVFAVAEQNITPLATALNAGAKHDGAQAPTKVFVQERMVSFLLATQAWRVKAYDSKLLPTCNPPISAHFDQLIVMDDLKTQYLQDQDARHLKDYYAIRDRITTELWRATLHGQSLPQLMALAQSKLENQLLYDVEKIYRYVLTVDAKNAVANHYLGVLEANQGQLNEAMMKFEEAVMADPNVEQYWVSYIDVLMLLDAVDTAEFAIAHGQKFSLRPETAAILLADLQARPAQFNPLFPYLKQAETPYQSSADESPIYLHLGCGERKFEGFINIDAETSADMQLDLTQPLPWQKSSVSGIYSEHFFEHISQAQGLALLHECQRVLKPGGIVRIAMPDLATVISDYVNNTMHPDWERFGLDWTATRCERLNIAMRWWGHQWIYDEEELVRLAKKVGLEVKGRCAVGESSEEMFKNREHRASSELIVEFQKPQRRLQADDAPLVTIAIPAYNPSYFAQSLESALQQSYAHTEILVCDDCPTDAIENIVNRYQTAKNPIRYLKNPPKTDTGDYGRENYLRCLREAHGEFIKYLNDDDMLAPDCVARMVQCFRDYEDITLVTSKRQMINAAGEPLADITATTSPVERTTVIEGLSLGTTLLTKKINFVGEPTTAMFRKADMIDNAPDMFSVDGKKFHSLGDVMMWLHLAPKGNTVYLTELLSYFRVHGEQVQLKNRDELLERDSKTWPAMQYCWQRLGFMRT
ncbi:MAG TPA: tetratricopeptide repeat protein, partial [Methylophilus sp.]